jgi:hypothetical protein
LLTLVLLTLAGPAVRAEGGLDFYEAKIRPLLSEHCFACHSAAAKKLKGGLRLDSRDAFLKGGDSGRALVPGQPEASLLIKAVRYTDSNLQMPPRGKLPASVIADLEQWVALGAPAPRGTAVASVNAGKMAEVARMHWSFQPLRRPRVPAVRQRAWVRNDIDAFVLARLEAAGLEPAPAAEPHVLLRRLHFDLIGVPPTPEEVEAVCANPQARVEVVERLLASPHYGERWARHWLDVARFADSAGYELDSFYASAWRYRDYVIHSLNADKPLDRFLQEQVAGDELWPDSEEARIATGLCTLGPYAFEGGIARPKVVEYQRLTDIADTIGAALLGLTVGCARCHDHKYDPITQADYFGLHAIFAGSEMQGIKISSDRRRDDGPMRVLGNRAEAPKVHLLRRGELDAPGEEVSPALFHLLPGGGPLGIKGNAVQGRRSALARWLTAPQNPLTARVLVNRVWQWHFGKGLVRTPNDFGPQGEPPTHPELLDYLADELIRSGWSLKHLHRLILNSATYRMSSRSTTAATEKDPEHRLLSRFPRRRLEAEILWDHLHTAAGTLNRKMFGPAIVPPADPEALKTLLNTNWNVTADKTEWGRRGIYLVTRRSLPLPLFDTFNSARPIESCAGRQNTVVAGQALSLLNNDIVHEQARALAARLLRECPDDANARVRRAWLLVFSRLPTEAETARTLQFLAQRASARADAVAEWCLALFNANEFLYVD